ncbi:recombinase family protein [Parendozoicomonas haliclonae]|uniref:DNA-invertase hin n=1 Tax=Parendozoicomonas haliclonae TaxID=1960125 RepID=A0A1X7AJ16_9GAMM|nr:recombinase family protein [Parendozoicomonas haliclonae]SMA40083.1 DNA-invertase hin [Parendozoicomonas haliclonae]
MSKGQQVAYVRVSTVLQNTDRQFAGMDFDQVFEDKASGKDTKRPALDNLCRFVRKGDTVHVWSIDRLSRSLTDLRKLVDDWMAQGVSVHFHKENMVFDALATGQAKAMQTMMLNMLGSFAEFELSIRAERQREGVAIAKAKGKYKGRQQSIDRKEVQRLLAAGMGATKIAEELRIGRKTVYRIRDEITATQTNKERGGLTV